MAPRRLCTRNLWLFFPLAAGARAAWRVCGGVPPKGCRNLVAPPRITQRGRNGTLLLYKCVAVPRAPGMRATHDVLGMTGGIIDGRHSDRRYRFWSKSTAKDNMLVERSPSDPPGAVLARTSVLQ